MGPYDGLVEFVVVIVVPYLKQDGVGFGVAGDELDVVDGNGELVVFVDGYLACGDGIPDDVGQAFLARGVGVLDGVVDELVE